MLPSKKLIGCITGNSESGMMELMKETKTLMPAGVPAFDLIRQRPTIKLLSKEIEEANMAKVLLLMVKDFCESFNVVRNMSTSQMVEAASMLLDECGDFRLEDYQVMFTMAKRGGLIDVRDRIDVSMIGRLMDEYFKYRDAQGKLIQEREFQKVDNTYNSKHIPPVAEDEAAASKRFSELVKQLTDTVRKEKQEQQQLDIEKRRKQIEAYANRNNINLEEIEKQFGSKKK